MHISSRNTIIRYIVRAVLISPPQSPAGLTGILRNLQEFSGLLRTPAGLHYDFADFDF
jgi:hypothetical protein